MRLVRLLRKLSNDYLSHRCQGFSKQIAYMKHRPALDDLYTLFWYTEEKVAIYVNCIGEYPGPYDWGVDWEYYARRKRQSGGRHLMCSRSLVGQMCVCFRCGRGMPG
jgi:hypothetical protein